MGIYCITNIITNHKYIGQSKNIYRRFYEHKCACENIPLKNAINKYGVDNFSFEIIRAISESKISSVLLDSLESFYIKKYKTMDRNFGYNRTSGGCSGKTLSEETKKLISDKHKGWHPTKEQLLRMSLVMRGKQKSEKWKKYMSENWHKHHSRQSIESMAQKLKGRPKSEEHKKKLSIATKKHAALRGTV